MYAFITRLRSSSFQNYDLSSFLVGHYTHALGVIARARGMTEVARASGLTREALYKALRPNSQPRFETIARVCSALGVRLVRKPAHI